MVQWQTDSARKIAKTTHRQHVERWHVTALRLHWKWAGKAARNKGTLNHSAATLHISPTGRGRPQAHWAQLLRQFSTKELAWGTQLMGTTRGRQVTMAIIPPRFCRICGNQSIKGGHQSNARERRNIHKARQRGAIMSPHQCAPT